MSAVSFFRWKHLRGSLLRSVHLNLRMSRSSDVLEQTKTAVFFLLHCLLFVCLCLVVTTSLLIYLFFSSNRYRVSWQQLWPERLARLVSIHTAAIKKNSSHVFSSLFETLLRGCVGRKMVLWINDEVAMFFYLFAVSEQDSETTEMSQESCTPSEESSPVIHEQTCVHRFTLTMEMSTTVSLHPVLILQLVLNRPPLPWKHLANNYKPNTVKDKFSSLITSASW